MTQKKVHFTKIIVIPLLNSDIIHSKCVYVVGSIDILNDHAL